MSVARDSRFALDSGHAMTSSKLDGNGGGAAALRCPAYRAARAQDASGWDVQAHTAVRLIAGAMIKTADTSFRARRYRDQARSRLEDLLARPGRFRRPADAGFFRLRAMLNPSTCFGPRRKNSPRRRRRFDRLHDHVILPLRVVPQEAAKPIIAAGQAQLCGLREPCACRSRQACTLPSTATAPKKQRSKRAEIRVPRRVALGAGQRSCHRLRASRAGRRARARRGRSRGARRRAGRAFRRRADARVVAAAAGTGRRTDGTIRRFSFDLDGLPPGADAKGATLTLTAVSGDEAIEVPAHLD